jgi:hypothetical protein
MSSIAQYVILNFECVSKPRGALQDGTVDGSQETLHYQDYQIGTNPMLQTLSELTSLCHLSCQRRSNDWRGKILSSAKAQHKHDSGKK